jgi:CheY-like chemotaxis protein
MTVMSSTSQELESVSHRLASSERSKKPKMLVVDDEPDNLDLLYRTFRRDFSVLRAESGVVALQVLAAEGEVAVIISDQRMPEMKGTEFLSKTVPQFPNTMRIILTGFTDVEDLVEAINSGQVYKYITKPWDPNELKAVVQRAAETYELLKQRTEELRRAQAQTALMSTIIQVARQADSVEACLEPIATAFGKNFWADGCILQLVEHNTLTSAQGVYGSAGELPNGLADDPLTQQAIATETMQQVADIAADSTLAQLPQHQNAGIQSHLVVPIIFQDHVLAILSLQWKQSCTLQEDELALIQLSAQQVGMALTCARHHHVVV